MTTQEYMMAAKDSLLHTYNRYQIVLEKGDGVYLYDTDGKNILILHLELQYLHLVITIKSTMMP